MPDLAPSSAPRASGHPLFLCGFRPFFLLTASYAVLALGVWLAVLSGLLPAAAVARDPIAWHAHEMIYGFAVASLVGFLLTALPEMTNSACVSRRQLQGLALLWLGGRAAFWLSPWLGVWPAALLNLGLAGWLLARLAPPIWRDPGRRQISFLYGMLALALAQAGFFVSMVRGGSGMPWLYAAVGVFMILIIVTVSRISMNIVNGGVNGDEEMGGVEYLARPPRRNLATFTIALYTAVELVLPGNPVGGWLALAAAAATLNLLNDWHIGRPLLRRWVLMLYAVYWLMAIGYGMIGISLLGGSVPLSAGRHVLMAGAMSLAILVVLCITSRHHAGHPLDRRRWVPAAALLVVAAGLTRAASGIPQFGSVAATVLLLSGALWVGAFALYLAYSWRVLAGPRPDNAGGCAGPVQVNQTPA